MNLLRRRVGTRALLGTTTNAEGRRKPRALAAIPLVGLLAIVLLAGCATPPMKGLLSPGTAVPAGESVVFGEIGSASAVPSQAFVSVMNAQRSIPVMQQPVEGQGGRFYWHLPPGQYALFELGWGYRGGSSGRWSTRRFYAGFDVESPDQIIYLGSLNLTLHSNSVSASVSDDFTNSVCTLRSKHPTVVGAPLKKLFKLQNTR